MIRFHQTASLAARIIQTLEEWMLAGSILTLAALSIGNVIARNLFNSSITAAEELSQWLMITICFVGLSYAVSRGRHIRMTALYDLLNPRWKKAFALAISILTSLLMAVLGLYACSYVRTVYQLGGISPALRIPFWIFYLSAPLGLFLAAFQYALAAIRNWKEPEVYLSFRVKDEKPSTPQADLG